MPIPPADSLPNAAFIDDPAVVSDKRLDLPHVRFFEGLSPQLTFRQNFNFEASDMNPNLGFDGGVLELSTDGGNTFQDILAAGGNFVIGGYNRVISTDRGSPVAGRQAWSGNSAGFITTVVNLPAFQTDGTLRWRMATDTGGSDEGWRVDTVDIIWCRGMGPPCTPTPTPTATATATVTPTRRYCYHDSHSYTCSYCDVYTQTNATTTVASEPSPAPESLAVRRQNRIHLLTR